MGELATRFRFAYDGGEIRLVSRQRVEMIVPPSDPPAGRDVSGFWFELRDENGAVLYRKTLHNPIRLEHEIYEEDTQSPTRVAARAPSGVFWLVGPALKNARTLVLHSSPLDPGRSRQAAGELVRFDLSK